MDIGPAFLGAEDPSEPVIVCRAGVGDPLALGEATLLERRARGVLEGLVRAGRAVGATSGRVYLGGRALEQRENLLREVERLRGEVAADPDGTFRIEVHEAPASLVCAEETAFLRAVEGGRPVPDFSPPNAIPEVSTHGPEIIPRLTAAPVCGQGRSGSRSLSGRPVVVVGPAELVAEAGAPCPVTYTLTGDVASPGVVEATPGMTVRELVFDHGGGVAAGGELKAVSVGGPTGGWLPPALLDVPATDRALRTAGAHLGAGTVAVIAHPGCAVHLARGALETLRRENCGKCVTCREGTIQMSEILGDIAAGRGRPSDPDLLCELARALKLLGTCDWGRTAADPVLTALTHFRDDFEAHVRLKKCPAGVCAVGGD